MKKVLALVLMVFLAFSLVACKGTTSDKKKVGISMPTQSLQRWNQDGANLKKQLEDAGYEVDLQFANNDPGTQITQLESMISGGCDVLVVTAIEAESLGTILQGAKDGNIPIIAYDRIIIGSIDVDYYATFDNFKVGVLQGTYVEEALDLKNAAGPFNVEFFAGDPGDANAGKFFDGAMSILKPYITSGKLVVSSKQTEFAQVATEKWTPEIAQTRMEALIASEGYSPSGKKLDAVVCSNDSTALGVTNALTAIGYTKDNIPVITGQDCDIANTKNMLAGLQSMSVFKDTRTLAARTVVMVNSLLKGEKVEVNDTTSYLNKSDKGAGTGNAIPTYHCDPVVCLNTVDSITKTLIDSEYYTKDQIGL